MKETYKQYRTFKVDNYGWIDNGRSVTLPRYRDDGVLVDYVKIGKSCIRSQRSAGVGTTEFKIDRWICDKYLQRGWRFGND